MFYLGKQKEAQNLYKTLKDKVRVWVKLKTKTFGDHKREKQQLK